MDHQEPFERLQCQLDAITAGLNRGGLNYGVSAGFFRVADGAGSPLSDILRKCLKARCVVGNTVDTKPEELCEEVTRCLSYSGDKGAGPKPSQIRKLAPAIQQFENDLHESLGLSEECQEFWLKEGHPYYPVFWDFAFVIYGTRDAYVLIASSSD